MTALAALQNDTTWLETRNYSVVPLNKKLISHISELAGALRQGVPAYPDGTRLGFYDLELRNGWCYVNVHDEGKTVYLVAFSPR